MEETLVNWIENQTSHSSPLSQSLFWASNTRWWSRRMCANLLLWEHQNRNSLFKNHWQEDTETYQKKLPSQPKKTLQWDGRKGHNHDQIKSHTCQVGNPQTAEQSYQRSSPTIVMVLNLMSGFPAWGSDKWMGNPQGIWPWRPARFDYRTSTGLGETEILLLEGTNKILRAPRPRGKEQWSYRSLNQT